jgi:Ca-activated chloride channel homolog
MICWTRLRLRRTPMFLSMRFVIPTMKHGKMDARDRYGVRVLDHLAGQTGGKTFDYHATDLKQAFAEIAGDLRSLYQIAYQSTNPTRDGSYRKVVIQTTKPGLTVRARTGYYAR